MMTSDIPSSKRRTSNVKDSPPSSTNPLAAAAAGGAAAAAPGGGITTTRKNDGGLLTKYFLVILFGFGVLSLIVNIRVAGIVGNSASSLEMYLENSKKIRDDGIPSSDDRAAENNKNDAIVNNNNNNKGDRPQRERIELKGNKKKSTIARPPLIERQQQQLHDVQQAQHERDEKDFNPFNVEQEDSRLAGLDCQPFGGPDNAVAEEMVYWEDIPQDQAWTSPFKSDTKPKYLTFEPDQGGWNNIRMGMETVLGLCFAMGRTLVLPPSQPMYLLTKDGHKQKNKFSFDSFFHMEEISKEHVGLDIISMKTFLEREAMTGHIVDHATGKPSFPPFNRTDWDEADLSDVGALNQWLRTTMHVTLWDPEKCLAVFPKSKDPQDVEDLMQIKQSVDQNGGFKSYEAYVGKPFPVDAPVKDRMMEMWAEREALCIYDDHMQEEHVLHFPSAHTGPYESRLLVHFYAFLFFQDWKEDLWMKRFMRDHVRYIDEVQCAAARIVQAIRERARSRHPTTNPEGLFDTFHIRRGDFQYKEVKVPAAEIFRISESQLQKNSTIYLATDEKDISFFKPLADNYDVVFLHDFMKELKGVNSNYYGMIDQLIASRGRKFFGCWFSTFTGYINRLRGYHVDDHKTLGYEQGVVPSWYYALEDRYDHMQTYYPIKRVFMLESSQHHGD